MPPLAGDLGPVDRLHGRSPRPARAASGRSARRVVPVDVPVAVVEQGVLAVGRDEQQQLAAGVGLGGDAGQSSVGQLGRGLGRLPASTVSVLLTSRPASTSPGLARLGAVQDQSADPARLAVECRTSRSRRSSPRRRAPRPGSRPSDGSGPSGRRPTPEWPRGCGGQHVVAAQAPGRRRRRPASGRRRPPACRAAGRAGPGGRPRLAPPPTRSGSSGPPGLTTTTFSSRSSATSNATSGRSAEAIGRTSPLIAAAAC